MSAGTTIKHKRKGSAFAGGDLAVGEWGLNTATGEWYYSNDGSAVTKIPSLLTAQNFDSQYVSGEHSVGNSGSGTVTIDWNNGNCQKVVMTGNCTFGAPSNGIAGGRYLLRLVGDGSSLRTPNWNAAFVWSGGSAPVLSGASKTDLIACYFTGSVYLCAPQANFNTVS